MASEKSTGKRTNLSLFIAGLILGIVITGFTVTFSMPKMMLTIHKSKLGFEETVSTIEKSAIERGWKVHKIYNLQKSISESGQGDIGRVKVISLCQPEHAYSILVDDSRKKVSAMMPSRLGVYETKKGDVYITGINIELMSKMFGGEIEKAMVKVDEEQTEMLKEIID
jgi:uncharacterized protein (DUF302 family)